MFCLLVLFDGVSAVVARQPRMAVSVMFSGWWWWWPQLSHVFDDLCARVLRRVGFMLRIELDRRWGACRAVHAAVTRPRENFDRQCHECGHQQCLCILQIEYSAGEANTSSPL